MAVSQPEKGDNEFLNGKNSFGLHQTICKLKDIDYHVSDTHQIEYSHKPNKKYTRSLYKVEKNNTQQKDIVTNHNKLARSTCV